MSARHGDPLRGLMSTARSPLFDRKFGRLFRTLPPASFGASEADNIANLTKLGAAMLRILLRGVRQFTLKKLFAANLTESQRAANRAPRRGSSTVNRSRPPRAAG